MIRCLRAFGPLSILLFALTTSAHAVAEGRVECSSIRTAKISVGSVGYCVMLPASYDADAAKGKRIPVLYLLHGLSANQESLINTGAWNQVEELQESKKIGEFAIIIPNGGNSFYIDAKSGRLKYESFFMGEFIPAIERKYRIGGSRWMRA